MIHAKPEIPELMHVVKNMRALSRAEMFMSRWDEDEESLAKDFFRVRETQWVAYHDGKPTAIIGAFPIHPGVWSLYGFGTDEYQNIMLTVTKYARRFITPMVKNSGAHRAQCTSPAHHKETHKWLNFLELKEEATLKGYGKNGEDAIIFAWNKE